MRSTLPGPGAHPLPDGSCRFAVWAPAHAALKLHIHESDDRLLDLERDDFGYHTATVTGVGDGTRYTYVFEDGRELPDPASRHQPDGVHAPSAVLAPDFDWQTDSWSQPDLRDMAIYELHVGTFTDEGTFDAAAARLPELRELGITAVELMPVAQFPGSRNWGYDGVYAFAAQSSYGGPHGLKRFVDAAHALDMAVVLDVVYNHLGPEGNYLSAYAPYFTDAYRTPWGDALNFDQADSDHVRHYFIESALQWTDEFRIDALRVDAVHAIIDHSAQPFLRELTSAVHARAGEHDREVVVIAESDLGDPRVLRSARLGGLGMDGQWLDDFHHALHALLTGEDSGYYADYGTVAQLARALQHGYVYAGEYSQFRRRRHGAPGPDILPHQFVVCAQNHDQVGNRMMGDRLTTGVDPARLRLAAATVLLSPCTPMLFMGEEYGEQRPFPYFVSHSDADLVEAVREGRRSEFASFSWQGEPPDPQAEETFLSAVPDWSARERSGHRQLLALHRRLLQLRGESPAIGSPDAITAEVVDADGREIDGDVAEAIIVVRRRMSGQSSLLLLNFSGAAVRPLIQDGSGAWRRVLDTGDMAWGGPGTTTSERYPDGTIMHVRIRPWSAVLLLHDES